MVHLSYVGRRGLAVSETYSHAGHCKQTVQGPPSHYMPVPKAMQHTTCSTDSKIAHTGDLAEWAVPHSQASVLIVGYHTSLYAHGHPKG